MWTTQHVFNHSVVSDSLKPHRLARPLSMAFSRQEYCSCLPFPLPGNLPDPGIKSLSPVSPALAGRYFATEPPVKPIWHAI